MNEYSVQLPPALIQHPFYIAIEGVDGIGKTSFIKALENKLTSEYGDHVTVLTVKEPATEIYGELCQEYNKDDPDDKRTINELFIERIIQHRIEQTFAIWTFLTSSVGSTRKVVITDRSWLSTIVYQEMGSGKISRDSALSGVEEYMRLARQGLDKYRVQHNNPTATLLFPGNTLLLNDFGGIDGLIARMCARGDIDVNLESTEVAEVSRRACRFDELVLNDSLSGSHHARVDICLQADTTPETDLVSKTAESIARAPLTGMYSCDTRWVLAPAARKLVYTFDEP